MKLSIIVPVYNLEQYIARTLDSLLSIHFSHEYEIIVINDGSADASAEIIGEYAKKHPRVVLYTIENQGVSVARNIGMEKASGEYVTFVDGDDTVEPEFFEKAVRVLDAEDCDLVQGNFRVIEGEKESFEQFTSKDLEITDKDEMMRLFFLREKLIHNSVWGKVYRAELLRGVLFEKGVVVAEDRKFVFDVLCRAKKIKLIKDISINYIARSSSALHTMNEKKLRDQLSVQKYFKDRVCSAEIKSYIEYHDIGALLSIYVMQKRESRRRDARETRKKILGYELKAIKRHMSRKTRVKIVLLKYAPFAYDFYIRRKRS